MSARGVKALLALAFVGALVAPVLAHMKQVKSSPAADATLTTAPKEVQVWFTEAPDAAVSKLTVAGPSGPVKVGPVHAMPDKSIMGAVDGLTADGKYTVQWQSAGSDGHVQKGEFAFTVRLTR